MRSKPLIAAACLVYLLGMVALAGASGVSALDVLLPHEHIGDIDRIGFNEPSGCVWHAGRGTLFVVGDEGDLCELAADGTPVRQAHIRDGDFEGVTYDPATGLVYIAVEGEEMILEIEPDTFEVIREFAIPREFEGQMLLKPGGQGIEALEFVPDPEHPEGGTFYAANQGFALQPAEDPSVIVEVAAPLRSGSGAKLDASIVRVFPTGVIDMAALHYDAARNRLFFVSDTMNAMFEMTRDGHIVRGWAMPGANQEGIALDSEGHIYIGQDHGGIIKLKWLRGRE